MDIGSNPMRTLYATMSPKRRRQLIVVLALTVAGALAEMLTIGATLPFLALLLTPRRVPANVTALLGRLADTPVVSASIILVVAAIGGAAIRLFLLSRTQRLVTGLGHDMSIAMFGRMLRQPYEIYVQRNSSEVLSGIEKVQAVVVGIFQPVMQGVTSAFMALCITILLFVIEPRVSGLVATGLILAYWGLGVVTREKLHHDSRIVAQARTARVKVVQEALGGIRDIILSRSQPLLEDKLSVVDRRFRDAQARTFFTSAAPRFVIEAAIIVVIATSVSLLSLRGTGVRQTLPVLGALAFGAHRLLPLLQQAYAGWSRTAGNIQMLTDVLALMNAPIGNDSSGDGAETYPFAQAIAFENVAYRHPGGSFEIEEVSLTIPMGARIGISGPTGSGKSTLVDLLMGLLEPTSGVIRIDGVELGADIRWAWQAQIAHVPQSIFLADDTIAANIAFGQPNLDRERMTAAAEAAQLTDFVHSLPHGFETLVGERGIRLSGGQRQRIGIARALYKGAPLLILDEATSALDRTTEAAVLDAVMAIDERPTIVVIAHAPSTLSKCERIIRLEQGRVVSGNR